MVMLRQALAAERERRYKEAEEMGQVGRALLQALGQRLDAEPLPGWYFVPEQSEIRIMRATKDGRRHVGSWIVDQAVRLALGLRGDGIDTRPPLIPGPHENRWHVWCCVRGWR